MSEKIYWLLKKINILPEDDTWLSDAEAERLEVFRYSKIHEDWLAGRWAAKHLLRKTILLAGSNLRELSILNEPSGAPYAEFKGRLLGGSLSISNRGGFTAAAFSSSPSLNVGIDIETIEEKSAGFIEDHFTVNEGVALNNLEPKRRDLMASLLWSAREAMIKAQKVGVQIDKREFEFQIMGSHPASGWQKLDFVRCPIWMWDIDLFWQQRDHILVTLAVKHPDQDNDITPDRFSEVTFE